MKLAKSLLLGSAAAIAATAGAQAADLPFRKAAPVEYVRVCDWTGAGYFYIPGSDTCLRIGGFVRMEGQFNSGGRAFVPAFTNAGAAPSLGNGQGSFSFEQANLQNNGGRGGFISGRNRDESGFFVRGRLEADTRTQTAYGTLRAFVRYQIDRYSGAENYTTASPAGFPQGGPTNGAYLDKAFIQFAGITAGRVQSFFDFGADPYGFEGVPTSDASTEVFAYTATFAGGFSATASVEAPNTRRVGITDTTGIGVAYEGDRLPDFVGALRVDQSWGAAQLSGAYHQVNTTGAIATASTVSPERELDGYAVRGAVSFKLPMLAAGDEFQVEGGYGSGAYSYVNSNLFMGGYGSPLIVGGFYHPSQDAIAITNGAGGYSLARTEAYSVSGGFVHYFTPQFQNIIFGGYEHIEHGAASRLPWYQGGLGNGDEYRIADQFNWFPVKNMQIGIEVMYIKVDQKVPGTPGDPVAGFAQVSLPNGIKKDPDAFEARLRMERDF